MQSKNRISNNPRRLGTPGLSTTMKFGKLIQAFIDEALPAWKDKFLPYKYLKKRLNSLLAREESVPQVVGGFSEARPSSWMVVQGEERFGCAGDHVTTAACRPGSKRGRLPKERNAKRRRLFDAEFEEEFKRLLDNELNKINEFVVDKEEEFVIKLQEFKEKVEGFKDVLKITAENHLDVINLQKDVVVFYGEMVLLENYKSLNYTGLVKIVKKHDRLTGAWLRLSFIPDVLHQPFYSTDILSRLVRECENNLLSSFLSWSGETIDHSFEKDMQESAPLDVSLLNEEIIKGIKRDTISALQTLQNMSKGSSTYNVFSIPPHGDNDDTGSVVDSEV